MEKLRVIDADTHVDETDATWEYMPPEEQEFKPATVSRPGPNPEIPELRDWMVNGKPTRRVVRSDRLSGTVVESRELLNVETRLRHMDEMGTETQIIYPTFFLFVPESRPDGQVSLAKSYNRWLADRCAESKGRLRWVCIPPVADIETTLEELRFAKDNGACGIFKKGDEEAGHWPDDPYYLPLYEEAERLDMPICFHTGSGTHPERRGLLRAKIPAVNGVYSLIEAGVTTRFSSLRTGCIEAGASWIPFVDYSLRRLHERQGLTSLAASKSLSFEPGDDLFKENRIYVTVMVDENIPMLLNYISEDNLLVGSDYTHQDTSHELGYLNILEARVERGELSESLVKKIVCDNAKAFYGL
jgi:predicted TIM-barrel fold metal-dependent hydrolase